MLLADAEPVPRVEELAVRGRDDGVVAMATFFHPAVGDGGVEVPHHLGLLDRVAGGLDPLVRAPDRVVAGGADEVADRPAVASR